MKKINRKKLKIEFLTSDFGSVKDFLVAKGIISKDQKIGGTWRYKVKDREAEKEKYREEKLAALKPSIPTLQKLYKALEKSIDTWAAMLEYYSNKQLEKIKQGKKSIYIDELVKFGKMLEKYHGIAIGTENTQQEVKHEIEFAISEEEKRLYDKILKRLNSS